VRVRGRVGVRVRARLGLGLGAAECSLVETVVAPALTGRWLTGARMPSGISLAARMTTTGQATTPSDASEASSSCGRWPGLGHGYG